MLQNEGGVDTILKLMMSHQTTDEFMPEALGTLCRLASDENEEMGAYIAEEGMHTIMEVIEANKDDVTMLDYCFKLVGFIAFRKDNVQLIVQQDGINVIMAAIAEHPDSEKLMTRCIKTLDFMAMARRARVREPCVREPWLRYEPHAHPPTLPRPRAYGADATAPLVSHDLQALLGPLPLLSHSEHNSRHPFRRSPWPPAARVRRPTPTTPRS